MTASQLSAQSSEGQTERCFYEPVLNIEGNGSVVIDYEKAKAKAFHVCKMKLAQQVSLLHINSLFRLNGCAISQQSRAQENFSTVTIEVSCCEGLTRRKVESNIICTKFSAVITCCVDEHQCVEDWAKMEDQSLDVARLEKTRIPF